VASRRARKQVIERGLTKVPTGIAGFDQITGGGLPGGRTTLVCGGAGCGKTLFGVQFLVNGAVDHGDPGVFVAFEETEDEIANNAASLGFDVPALIDRGLLAVDFIKVERHEIAETGEYDLEGLFVRLGHIIDSIGARRVVLDTIEALFGVFSNEALLRSELRRLFRWLKDRGVTAVITAERGTGTLTRYGLEEYVSDCVVSLDNRISEQVATRRLRIVKYRGSSHGSNEYPFLIDVHGFSVMPVTGLQLDYEVSAERVATGVAALDGMLDGGGYYRGSSVLISGSAGTGKSTLAGLFVDAACRRKERALYFALEESSSQVMRNMRSIGLDLAGWERKKLLRVQAARPTVFGLEMHLVTMHKLIEELEPRAVVIDPISSLVAAGNSHDVKSMLIRLFDYLKLRQITCVVTSLTGPSQIEESGTDISSLIDTWLQLRDIEISGERTRGVYLVKSRGMAHSNQVREFVISSHGVDLVPVAIGPDGVLTGSAREQYESAQAATIVARKLELERRERQLARKRKAMIAQIEAMQTQFAGEEEEAAMLARELHDSEEKDRATRDRMARQRSAGFATRGGSQ
jgi:circadian clock protein KaiC